MASSTLIQIVDAGHAPDGTVTDREIRVDVSDGPVDVTEPSTSRMPDETDPTRSTGGAASREVLSRLIEENLPLVNHVVFQVAVHFPRHVDREELARAGALGLVEAAQRFDESKGVPFPRFAAQRIRGAIIDAVRAADWAPRSVRSLARRLDVVEQRLATRLGRVPSQGEMAEALEMSRDELDRLRDRLFRSVVLAFEHMVTEVQDEELTLVDVLADHSVLEPSQELEKRELHAYLRDAIALLPERQRLVIVGYFLQEKTSQELARFLGVTESRVSQMRTEALEMLKEAISAQYESNEDVGSPQGRVARRRAAYADAVGSRQDVGERISEVVGLADLGSDRISELMSI